jgi:hypothetical protein
VLFIAVSVAVASHQQLFAPADIAIKLANMHLQLAEAVVE